MQFHPDEQTQLLTQGVRAFADAQLRKTAEKRDRAGSSPRELLQNLADLGLMGLTVAEEHGGLALDPLAATLALEELAAADAGLALLVLNHQLVTLALQSQQKHQDLPHLANGKLLAVWAHGEDALHRDAQTVATRATQENDQWRLQGQKPDVFGANVADLALVTARTDAGIAIFLVDLHAQGVRRSQPTDALGLRTASLATLHLDNVLLNGPVPIGLESALPQIGLHARLGVAAIALGIAREALKLAGRYALERQQFGKPIAQFQPIQWQVANSAVELDAATLLVHRAAWTISQKLPMKAQENAVAMARLTAGEMATRVTDRAIQLHGGYGYTREFSVERLYRDAWTLDSLHGSPGQQRIELARRLTV